MSLRYDYCLKFVVVGDACSGKTTMVQDYVITILINIMNLP